MCIMKKLENLLLGLISLSALFGFFVIFPAEVERIQMQSVGSIRETQEPKGQRQKLLKQISSNLSTSKDSTILIGDTAYYYSSNPNKIYKMEIEYIKPSDGRINFGYTEYHVKFFDDPSIKSDFLSISWFVSP